MGDLYRTRIKTAVSHNKPTDWTEMGHGHEIIFFFGVNVGGHRAITKKEADGRRQMYLAATRFRLFDGPGATSTNTDTTTDFRWCRGGSHPALDFSRHCHKCLFYIGSIFS